MSVGNTGALATLDNANGGMQSSPNSTPMFSDKLDLPNVSSGILDIPEGQELVFEGGVPYLRKNTRQVKISSISNLLVSACRYEKHCRKTFLWKPV